MKKLALTLRDFLLRRPCPALPPLRLWVDITSRCNLSCPACAQRLLPPDQRRDMDEGLLASLAAQAGPMGAMVSLFHRGEPLLHPRLAHWVRAFKSAGSTVRLHTNATLLDAQKSAQLLAAAPNFITLSLDTLDETAYAAARPGADFFGVLAEVERLLRLRPTVTRGGPQVNLLLMGRQPNGPRAAARLDRLLGLGLDGVRWRVPHNWGGAVGRPRTKTGRPAVCSFPWYSLTVLSDGRVSPCPQDFMGEIVVGQAHETPLLDIWRGQALMNLRQAHGRRQAGALPVCSTCDRVWRPTLLGLPTEHLKNFIAESIVRAPGGR